MTTIKTRIGEWFDLDGRRARIVLDNAAQHERLKRRGVTIEFEPVSFGAAPEPGELEGIRGIVEGELP